jgi:hypothetical protein
MTGSLRILRVAHHVPALPLVVSYRRSPDSLLPESIARLARAVMLDYSLLHGPEFALTPESFPESCADPLSSSMLDVS